MFLERLAESSLANSNAERPIEEHPEFDMFDLKPKTIFSCFSISIVALL